MTINAAAARQRASGAPFRSASPFQAPIMAKCLFVMLNAPGSESFSSFKFCCQALSMRLGFPPDVLPTHMAANQPFAYRPSNGHSCDAKSEQAGQLRQAVQTTLGRPPSSDRTQGELPRTRARRIGLCRPTRDRASPMHLRRQNGDDTPARAVRAAAFQNRAVTDGGR